MFDPADDGSQPLAERISRAFLATQELLTIQLGRQLGLYETLAADAAMTAGTLAARSGCDERYLPRVAGATGGGRIPRRR